MPQAFDFKPDEPTAELRTIHDLKSWMVKNGCNFLSYQIDSAPIYEGFILAEVRSFFHWIYTERGVERTDMVFRCELDAVSYAYKHIRDDGWAWSHMVGFAKDKAQLGALRNCLQSRNIAYYEDEIPFGGKDDTRYRIYVHGSRAEAVADLKLEFGA
ncbi:hypothetical protein [Roseinatronobacter alkalisoli]|uniref:Uncharacterized protein n=1 Tax=Roseinatronobacter alkalisoli TaxID=3028235 RepID=A0ABT5TEY2_9RHOB|nr:hypothetical protein [Roseinatronobacter sp. HJB301]MDD7972468.1 hypothetical protein [Roseinatronobacter sp. HJB301]